MTILINKMITPDGHVMISRSRHNYLEYKDNNGDVYILDGGTNYVRRSINEIPATVITIEDTDPHELIREHFEWGTYGKNGDQELKYVVLKDLTDDHLQAIIRTQTHLKEHILKVFFDELEHRKNNG